MSMGLTEESLDEGSLFWIGDSECCVLILCIGKREWHFGCLCTLLQHSVQSCNLITLRTGIHSWIATDITEVIWPTKELKLEINVCFVWKHTHCMMI